MVKASVEVDQDIVREAAAVLGTRTLKDTINAALLDVLQAKRRLEAIQMLSDAGRFDFAHVEDAWAGSQ